MYGFRTMLGLAAAVATLAFTAPSFASTSQTMTTHDPGWGNVIVVSYSTAFDFAPLAIYDARPSAVDQRSYHVTKPLAIKAQRFGAAVNATSKAGWGSGRLRKLAG